MRCMPRGTWHVRSTVPPPDAGGIALDTSYGVVNAPALAHVGKLFSSRRRSSGLAPESGCKPTDSGTQGFLHAAHGSLTLVLGLALTLALAGGRKGLHKLPRMSTPTQKAQAIKDHFRGPFQRPVLGGVLAPMNIVASLACQSLPTL